MPVANLTLTDNVYTFENVTIDASASYDNDGGNVECYFEIKEPTDDGIRTELIDSTTCITSWFWADDGDWEVKVIVVDDELDEVHMTVNATILNRAPYVNLTTSTPVVDAGQSITFNASDSGDIDTISPKVRKSKFRGLEAHVTEPCWVQLAHSDQKLKAFSKLRL